MDNSYKFFSNTECKYYPCHEGLGEMNCLFCYCPLYHLENCPGNPSFKVKDSRKIKICTACTFPHRPENYEKVISLIREQGK